MVRKAGFIQAPIMEAHGRATKARLVEIGASGMLGNEPITSESEILHTALMIGVPSHGLFSGPPQGPPYSLPQNDYIYKFIRKIYFLKF